MDIMDSSDTPTGGLDTSSSSALPLSVDQRDDFASPTNRSTMGGQQPTSFSSAFSSGSSAMDRMDYAARTAAIDEDAPNAMPTSTDDIMMPHVEYASHPSITGDSGMTADPPGPTAQELKDKANRALESAKDKANSSFLVAKDKASDARDKAADMTESARDKMADMSVSAKAKAADMTDSAKAKAHDLSTKAGDMAETVKEKLVEGVEKVKETGHHLVDSAKSSIHHADKTVHDKADQVKDKLAASTATTTSTSTTGSGFDHDQSHHPVTTDVKSTQYVQETDTHPDASSMRDRHLHSALSSLPSHETEKPPVKDIQLSDSHQRALLAGEAAHTKALADAAAEPKDASAQGGGASGLLYRMHDKLEEGIDAVKDKVDGFMERNVRSEHDGEHLSGAKARDLPTLIDHSNPENVTRVRGKMHPSQERTTAGHAEEEH